MTKYLDDYNAQEELLMEQLKEVESAYAKIGIEEVDSRIAELPDRLELERLSYNPPDDKELESYANSKYEAEYIQGSEAIKNNIESLRSSLMESKDSLTTSQQTALESIDKAYTGVIESISNQAIKRGLGRSSIVMNKISETENAKASQISSLESATTLELEKIDNEIIQLESVKANALASFDLEYASKVQAELETLMKEREKKTAEVIEFNNKQSKTEGDYNFKRAKEINDIKDDYGEVSESDKTYYKQNGFYPSEKDEYKDRYDMASEFYLSVPAARAKEIFNENNDLKEYLGSTYYNQLRTIILMRK